MLDPETEMSCSLYLFLNVQNSRDLQTKITNGELDCCIVKPALVVDPFQIIVAANKAALNAKLNKMTTRSLHTEILFCMSTSKNIVRSLSEFGINHEEKNLLMAVIQDIGDETCGSDLITNVVNGERVPISKLSEFTDYQLVKKIYNIDNDELNVCSLTDSIVSRISCKDFVSIK